MKEIESNQEIGRIPLHIIDDEQINDEFYLLNMKGRIDRDTIWILRHIKQQLPYKDGDFRLVEVKPFKDEFIDYTEVIFDLTAILEQEELYNDDESTVFMEKQHARTLAQVGILFDIIPEDIHPIELPVAVNESYEDEPWTFRQPTDHSPDLPLSLPIYNDIPRQLELPLLNGHSKERPVFERKRIDPKIYEELV